MLWIVCAVITIVIIALSVRLYVAQQNRSMRIVSVLACLIAATYVAYIPVYVDTYSLLSGLVGNLINVLQVITVDADLMDFYSVIREGTHNVFLADFYMVILGALHLALPTISALTAVTVLLRCFSSFQMVFANNSKKPLFIFSERNERSIQLAKSLEQSKCTIIFAGTEKSSLDAKSGDGPDYIYKEDPLSGLKVKISNKRDVYYFCISDDENDSLSLCLQVIDKYSNIPDSLQEKIHVFLFSQYLDYSVFIDSSNKGLLDVQCFNEYEILIYKLLDQYPLFRYAGNEINILLYGLSHINLIALKAIIWCGQLSGFSLRISVVGQGICRQVEELKLDVPGLFSERYNVSFFDCGSRREMIETVHKNCSNANYIIVSAETDNDTMNAGILLRRTFYKSDPAFKNCPPIFCFVREPSKSRILQDLSTAETHEKRKMAYNLIPFGSILDVYTYKDIIDSDINRLAKNVHLAYEEIFSDDPVNISQAMKRFNAFEVNKRSNRANALHIRYKLNMLGLDYVSGDDGEDVNMRDYYTDEYMDRLSTSEHNRWMAFLEMEGWLPAKKEEVYAYRKSDISKGRHNCPILKMHPYICKYEHLHDLSLDLEGKDTTVYDKELILRIPDILGDKWNVTGKKYRIIEKKI